MMTSKNKKYDTVKSNMEDWLFNIKKYQVSNNYFDSMRKYSNCHIYPNIGYIKLKDLKLRDIQGIINSMQSKGLSAKYIKEVISILKTSLQLPIQDEICRKLDFSYLIKPKIKKSKVKVLTKDEEIIFLNYINSNVFDIYYLPIVLVFLRGLRPEEVAGLKWKDINYDNDYISVERAVVRINRYANNNKFLGRQTIVKDTKTDEGVRKLPLGNFLSLKFKEKHSTYLKKGIIPNLDDFIFKNQYNQLYYESSLRGLFYTLRDKLGISSVTLYSLRHVFCTRLLRNGCNLDTLKKLMGHTDIDVTQLYMNTDFSDMFLEISKVDNILNFKII